MLLDNNETVMNDVVLAANGVRNTRMNATSWRKLWRKGCGDHPVGLVGVMLFRNWEYLRQISHALAASAKISPA